MKINEALKRIQKTGKITYGTEETLKALEDEEVELIITAENTPRSIEEKIEEKTTEKNIPKGKYPGTSMELGEACRRPHLATVVTIKDTGNMDIREIEGITLTSYKVK